MGQSSSHPHGSNAPNAAAAAAAAAAHHNYQHHHHPSSSTTPSSVSTLTTTGTADSAAPRSGGAPGSVRSSIGGSAGPSNNNNNPPPAASAQPPSSSTHAQGSAPPSSYSSNRQQVRATRGRSLEFPDLVPAPPPSLNGTAAAAAAAGGGLSTSQRVPSALPSAPIPIPNASGRPPRDPPPRIANDSDADLAAGPSALVVPQQPQNHPQTNVQPKATTNHQQQQAMPPLVPVAASTTSNASNASAGGPPIPTRDAPASRTASNASFTRRSRGEREQQYRRKRPPYKQHVVRSNLPSGVPTAHDGIVNVIAEGPSNERVPVLVSWRAGGTKVLVTGTYEPTPWENKTELEYEAGSKCFKTIIQVAPAAYHLKFIVDDVWRCSEDLPTATDGAGHLVNYIDVRRRGEEIKEWGRDWWGVGTEEDEELEQGAWSSQYPPYLISAAEQEEIDEALRRGQRPPPGTQRLVPFPLPRPPVLPRHLDKVILNQRVVPSTTSSTTRTEPAMGGSSGSRSRGVTPLTSTVNVPGGGPGNPFGAPPGGVVDLDAPRRRERRRTVTMGPDGGIASPIGDDNSVLPMPSHSVVNHLATSAIRNGVLAVGTTTRYKAKYISTICYRPTRTSPPPQEGEYEEGEHPPQPQAVAA